MEHWFRDLLWRRLARHYCLPMGEVEGLGVHFAFQRTNGMEICDDLCARLKKAQVTWITSFSGLGLWGCDCFIVRGAHLFKFTFERIWFAWRAVYQSSLAGELLNKKEVAGEFGRQILEEDLWTSYFWKLISVQERAEWDKGGEPGTRRKQLLSWDDGNWWHFFLFSSWLDQRHQSLSSSMKFTFLAYFVGIFDHGLRSRLVERATREDGSSEEVLQMSSAFKSGQRIFNPILIMHYSLLNNLINSFRFWWYSKCSWIVLRFWAWGLPYFDSLPPPVEISDKLWARYASQNCCKNWLQLERFWDREILKKQWRYHTKFEKSW